MKKSLKAVKAWAVVSKKSSVIVEIKTFEGGRYPMGIFRKATPWNEHALRAHKLEVCPVLITLPNKKRGKKQIKA